MPQSPAKLKSLFLVVAAIALIIGVLGVLDQRNVPFTGYFSDPNNTVIRVFAGSPAEEAGLEVGDVVQSTGGISMQNSKALARRPRAEIGESRAFVVERGGEALELDLVYAGLPMSFTLLGYAGALIGLCYLAFGLWPYLKAPGSSSTFLALFGLCFGIAFLPGPYSSSYALRTLGGAISTFVVVLGFAFLLRYLLEFPQRRAFLGKPSAKMTIYGPALIVALFLLFLTLFQPEATSTLNTVTGILIGLFIVGYFGWALAAMVQSYRRATPQQRSGQGLNVMLLGTILGLLPITISAIVGVIAPSVWQPGAQFYFLTLVLIPISFAVAALKSQTTPVPTG